VGDVAKTATELTMQPSEMNLIQLGIRPVAPRRQMQAGRDGALMSKPDTRWEGPWKTVQNDNIGNEKYLLPHHLFMGTPRL
jgi:hypothetical protein